MGGVVKVINLAGQYGLQAYYIVYLHSVHHMDQSLAILTFTIFGIVAVIGDVFWGIVGDRLGWRNTLQWAATPICAASLVYLYVIPNVVGPNFWLIALGMAAIGIGLSAHVPTTPLIMAHAKGETGNALAILNLGAGLGAFVGPAVVTALVKPFGYAGVAYALAGLYVISFALLFGLKLPGNARVLTTPLPEPSDSPDAAPARTTTPTDEGGPALVNPGAPITPTPSGKTPTTDDDTRAWEEQLSSSISDLRDPVN